MSHLKLLLFACFLMMLYICYAERKRKTSSDDDEGSNGNMYDFGTSVCEGYRDLWEDPSVPLSERNMIGRAIFQTPAKVRQATRLIKKHKGYTLGRSYVSNMTLNFGRHFNTELGCRVNTILGWVGCTMTIDTNAIGNIGTQFDSFGHFSWLDVERRNDSDFPSNRHIVLWNNFRGSDVFQNFAGNGDVGIQYFSAHKLPTFYTKAILVDIAGAKGVEVLPKGYGITSDDFMRALSMQDLELDDIGAGDVVLVNTGWGTYYETNIDLFYDNDPPGLLADVVLDIIFPTNAVILGSDTWIVDNTGGFFEGETRTTTHFYFMTCGGGFIHELLDLEEWVNDARNGDAPWVGAYIFQAMRIQGAVASAGSPVVYI